MSSVVISGNTSGTITLDAPAVAGTTTLTLPATSGTVIVNSGAQTIEFADGSAGAPSITNSGDTNTGMFFPAADTIAFAEGGTEAMRLDSSGNVGIGYSLPNSRLGVFNSQADGAQTVANAGLLFGQSGGWAQAGIWPIGGSGFAGSLIFGTVPSGSGTFTVTERMRIDSSGNVSIGIASSNGDRLVVAYDRAAQQGITIRPNANSGGGNAILFLNASGTLVGYIATTASNTVYSTSSDYRLKENIAPMTGALDKIAQLKPVTYNWKIDGSSGQGFIAHELQEIVPDCVIGEKDAVETYTDENGVEQTKPKYQGVDTSFLVATLTAAIQELKAELDTVKAELATLKGAA